jgi:hypothetical protein
MIFIPRKLSVSASRPLRRQSQQSCALWRASPRWPFSLTLELVELIGIEPMT